MVRHEYQSFIKTEVALLPSLPPFLPPSLPTYLPTYLDAKDVEEIFSKGCEVHRAYQIPATRGKVSMSVRAASQSPSFPPSLPPSLPTPDVLVEGLELI